MEKQKPLPLIRYLRPGVAQADGFVKHGAAVWAGVGVAGKVAEAFKLIDFAGRGFG